MTKFKKFSTPILIIALVLTWLFVYREWFFNFGILSQGDWGYYFVDSLKSVRIDYFTTWLGDSSFGRTLVDTGQAPTYAAYGFMANFFHITFAFSERIVHMWPCIIAAPVGTYFLLKHFVKNRLAMLCGILFYSFNTYFLTLQTGHLTLAGAYAFYPLAFYLSIRYYESKKISLAFYLAFVLSIMCAYEPRGAFVGFIGIGIYLFIQFFKEIIINKNLKLASINLSRLFIPLVIFLLINVYWIIGIISSASADTSTVTSGGLFGSEYFTLNYALSLFHPYWIIGGSPIPFALQKIPVYYWIVPLVVFVGVSYQRKNVYVLSFGAIACVGVFLAKQSDMPLGSIYQWLYDHVPGFNAYREASKFYLLIALSYSVIIATFIDKISRLNIKGIANKYQKLPYVVISLFIVCICIINASGLIKGSQGTLFVNRNVPTAESEVDEIIKDDKSPFFRTLWLPTTTRWSYFTNTKPAESLAGLDSNKWDSLLPTPTNDVSQKINKRITNIFNYDQYKSLLDNASIKYLVVPSRDTQNENDFFVHFGDDRQFFIDKLSSLSGLKRIPTKNKSIALFKNTNFKDYAYSISNIVQTDRDSLDNDADKFITENISKDYSNDILLNSDTNNIKDVFGNINVPKNTNDLTTNITGGNNSYVYVNNRKDLYYSVQNNKLNFTNEFSRLNTLSINGTDVLTNEEDNVASLNLSSAYKTYINNGDKTYQVTNSDFLKKPLDSINQTEILNTRNQNLITNGSFESGLWNKQVEDCNKYDNLSSISMLQSSDSVDGKASLQLKAARHTACSASNLVNVEDASKLIVEFNYKVQVGSESGFDIRYYSKDGTYTTAKNFLHVTDGNWRKYIKTINVPTGTSMIQLVFSAIPNDNSPFESTALFDSTVLKYAESAIKINSLSDNYKRYKITNRNNEIKVNALNYDFSNVITNGSFESGLWSKSASDCNAYDNKPQIKMVISSQASEGKRSLELSAKRHIACTSPNLININGGSNYVFKFDYRGTANKYAGYSIVFNDPAKTLYSNSEIKIKSGNWNTYSVNIKAPNDATSARLTLYSYGSKLSNSYATNLYDNVMMIRTPDIFKKYYVVANLKDDLPKEGIISSRIDSPTEKSITVSHVRTAFYLGVSESYDPKWRLSLINNSSNKHLTDVIKAMHYDLNGLNGWKINPDEICASSTYCQKNDDGSYNFLIRMEFTPQSYMNIGLLISGSTFLLGFILSIFQVIKRIRTHREDI